jgi:hypothetical protein
MGLQGIPLVIFPEIAHFTLFFHYETEAHFKFRYPA